MNKTGQNNVIQKKPKIYEGDCIDILKSGQIKEKFDLTFLDPPFNQGKEYENYNDSIPHDDYWDMMHTVCKLVYRQTKKSGSIYFMQREKNLAEMLDVLQQTNWHLQNIIIWKKKTSAVPMGYRYGKHYQPIVFATKTNKPGVFNKLRIDPPPPQLQTS